MTCKLNPNPPVPIHPNYNDRTRDNGTHWSQNLLGQSSSLLVIIALNHLINQTLNPILTWSTWSFPIHVSPSKHHHEEEELQRSLLLPLSASCQDKVTILSSPVIAFLPRIIVITIASPSSPLSPPEPLIRYYNFIDANNSTVAMITSGTG